jgi:uncharacterized protein (TIGR03435 family)
MTLLADHLWQSTLFAAAIALLTLAFRRNRPHVRYWLWFAASMKFLIPFGALVALGGQVEWRYAQAAPIELTETFEAVTQPFSQSALTAGPRRALGGSEDLPLRRMLTSGLMMIWVTGSVVVLFVWALRWRRMARLVGRASSITDGSVVEALSRIEARSTPEASTLRIVASDARHEPGVFGLRHPVLLWPRGIEERLTDRQIEAILAHEIAHVSRRDNLTAALHMLVEAIFWFHPLAWWIGAWLVEERERACDEDVIASGSDPNVYAESILKTCQFYVEAPLVCVVGVTGSDLKKRIERIMTSRQGSRVTGWKRVLLAATACIAIAIPFGVGVSNAQQPVVIGTQPLEISDQGFEVATVRPNKSGVMRVSLRMLPGGTYEAFNVTLESMIRMAFRMGDRQIAGGPEWITRDRFDIVGKWPEGGPPAVMERMQKLLVDRFALKAHKETRELPIYELVLADRNGKTGPQLTVSTADCTAGARGRGDAVAGRGPAPIATLRPGERPSCGVTNGRGRVAGGGQSMAQLAASLSRYSGRTVVDRTGLTGRFDYDLEFAMDPSIQAPGIGGGLPPDPQATRAADPEGVSIFTAVQDQLGLKLESARGPVDVVVIDSVSQPTEN